MPALPSASDRSFSVAVRINGKANESLYKCVQRISVDEDLEVGSSFNISLVACRNDDGSWPYLEDPNLKVWNRVTVYASFPKQTEVVIDGYIAEIAVSTQPEQSNVGVEIRGVDAAYHMNLEQKTRIWIGKSYETIAKEILESYKFKAQIAAAPAGDTPPHSVAQRATDHAFLRELARRKGYEFFVQGGTGLFRPPPLDGTPQKLIAVNFGEETNCTQFRVEADGTAPTVATAMFIDPMTGAVEDSRKERSDLRPLGTDTLDAMRGAVGVPQTVHVCKRLGCVNKAAADDYTLGLLRRSGWWVTASGRLNGLRYGRVLRSRKLVTIKGGGPTYNGMYYVRRVKHELTMRTYEMDFEAVRNAVGKLGSEDFEGEKPDSLAPPALGPGADTDTVRVVESGPRVLPA
jgi:uncharacterized protein